MEKTTILIPCHNEIGCIKQTIEIIKKFNMPIIVVDDFSTDGSRELLKGIDGIILICNNTNLGYGGSLKEGLKFCDSDYVLIIDADGTYPLIKIPEFVEEITDYDMVVGNRIGKIPFHKKIAKGILKTYASIMCKTKIPDLNSGMRIFKREMAMKFFDLFPNGFSFTSTITMCALLNNYKVKYVDIDYNERVGKSHIKSKDFFKFFWLITKLSLKFKPLSFIKYGVSGVLFTIFTSFIVWLLIDLLKFPTLWVFIPLNISVFLLKYPVYKQINLLKSGFWKYIIEGGIIFLLTLGFGSWFMWLFVDILGQPAYLMNFCSIAMVFLSRYFLFKIRKLF